MWNKIVKIAPGLIEQQNNIAIDHWGVNCIKVAHYCVWRCPLPCDMALLCISGIGIITLPLPLSVYVIESWVVATFTRFHLALRFWNHILICTSLRHRLLAIVDLSERDRYFLLWNSFSSSSNCSLVKAVRRRLGLSMDARLWLESSCVVRSCSSTSSSTTFTSSSCPTLIPTESSTSSNKKVKGLPEEQWSKEIVWICNMA